MLPLSVRNVMAESKPSDGSLDDVEHVIILMQENRPFDQYFGTLSGVRGFDDPLVHGRSRDHEHERNVFYQPDPKNPDGYELPFHLDTETTSAACPPSLSHAWTAQHASWNGGKMDGWIRAHRKADGDQDGPLTMGYYTRQDLPFYYALADAFTICDSYFCSVMGPTRPNRLYMYSGTIDPDGDAGGPIVANSEVTEGSVSWTTYPERLDDAGVSWRVYWEDYGNLLPYFEQYQNAPTDSSLYRNGVQKHGFDEFANDVKNDDLPQVSWLNGPYHDSEHPSYLPAKGAEYVYNVLDVLASNPDVWSKTALFLTYDENDGYFDHVTPPTPPAGTHGEYLTAPLPDAAGGVAGPIGLGFRVPMLVISPWSQGGWVSSEVFDHTSLLQFLEARFGVREPNISAWRRERCGDLTDTLRLHQADDSFPELNSPKDKLTEEEKACKTKPAPKVPTDQTMPHQEKGGRKHLPARPW